MNHFWTVRVSIPYKGVNSQGTPYTTYTQETFGVKAITLEDAVARIRLEQPEAVIWAVNHHGKIHYL